MPRKLIRLVRGRPPLAEGKRRALPTASLNILAWAKSKLGVSCGDLAREMGAPRANFSRLFLGHPSQVKPLHLMRGLLSASMVKNSIQITPSKMSGGAWAALAGHLQVPRNKGGQDSRQEIAATFQEHQRAVARWVSMGNGGSSGSWIRPYVLLDRFAVRLEVPPSLRPDLHGHLVSLGWAPRRSKTRKKRPWGPYRHTWMSPCGRMFLAFSPSFSRNRRKVPASYAILTIYPRAAVTHNARLGLSEAIFNTFGQFVVPGSVEVAYMEVAIDYPWPAFDLLVFPLTETKNSISWPKDPALKYWAVNHYLGAQTARRRVVLYDIATCRADLYAKICSPRTKGARGDGPDARALIQAAREADSYSWGNHGHVREHPHSTRVESRLRVKKGRNVANAFDHDVAPFKNTRLVSISSLRSPILKLVFAYLRLGGCEDCLKEIYDVAGRGDPRLGRRAVKAMARRAARESRFRLQSPQQAFRANKNALLTHLREILGSLYEDNHSAGSDGAATN